MKNVSHSQGRLRTAIAEIAALSAIVFSGSNIAWAADKAAGEGRADDAVEEVVVTARLRSERVQDIPDTIAVIRPEFLERNQVTTLKDVTLLMPNVGISESLSPGSSFINIRGINTIRNSDPAVAIILDGVQFNNVNQVSQDLNDIAQIEVLKGPQGALYGRNAIGGAVNIVTTTPTNETQGLLQAGGGNGGTVQARGSISGPIVQDKLFYRFTAFANNTDGFIENSALDRKTDFSQNANVRARLRYLATDRLTFDFRLSWDGLKAGTYYYVPVVNAAGVPIFNQPNNFRLTTTANPISVDYRNIIDTSLRTDYKLDAVTLTAITAQNHTTEHYGRPGEGIGPGIPGDLDWTANPILANSQTWAYTATTADLRLSSNNSSGVRWTGGVYYFHQDRAIQLPVSIAFGNYAQALNNLFATLGGVPTPLGAGLDPNEPLTAVPSQNDRTTTKDYAGYGNVVLDLTSSLEGTLGIRYDSNDISQRDLSYNSSRSVKYSAFQPKASLSYKVGADDRVYVTASKGFRSGGFNSVINTVATAYSPETLWNYEVGIKAESPDHTITANAAVFFEDYKNSQQFQFDGKTATQTIFNIRKSQIYGAEFDVEAHTPVTGLTLQASAGILDSKIQSTDGLPGVVADAVGNVIGNKLPIINHWTFMVGGQYSHALSNGWVVTPSVDFSGRGRQYWYIDNVNEAPELFLLNAAVVVNSNTSWKAVLSVKNLADRKWYSDYESQRQTGLFTDVVWPQAGRVFLATITYSF